MLNNRYTGYLFVALTLIVISCIFLINRINYNYEKVSHEEQRKFELFKLVDELRQSSDDLTRMARLYVVRQDTLYLHYFNQILQIRDGLINRPIEYNDIYWDYVLSDGKIPRPGKSSIPLVDLIKANCESEEVIQYFIKAKNSSDDLVAIELEAFNAMNGFFLDKNGEFNIVDKPNVNYAVELLHNKKYHEAKAKIMKSIQDFLHFANNYSNKKIETYSKRRDRLANTLLAIVGFTVIIMLIILFFIFSKGEKKVDKLSKKNTANLYSLQNIWRELRKSWQLVLVSAIFSFLIVLIFAFTYRVVKNNVEDNIEQSLHTILETTTHTIENWLLDLETEIDKFVHQVEFKTLLQSTLIKRENIKSENFENLIDLYFSQSSYNGYILIDQTGEIIVSDKKNWLENNITDLDTDAFFRSLISRETNIATSVPNNGGALASYNALIKMGHSVYSDSDEYLGSFILLYNPQLRFTDVLNGGRMGSSGESYAFNRLGEMISESRFDNDLVQIGLLKEGEKSQLNIILKDPGADLTTGAKPALNINEQAFTFMAREAMKGYGGVNTSGYNDYRGVKVIGVWNWIEQYGFGITTEIDYREAFKTLILIEKLNTYSSSSFIILLFFLTGFFIINRIRLSYLNQEMDKQTSLLSSLLNSIPDLIFYKDKDSVYMGANKAFEKLVAKKVSEFVGQTDDALFPMEVASVFLENDQKMLADGSTKFNEEEVSYPDGRKVILETLKTPFFSNEGELLGLIGISRDITERKLMEKKLGQQSAALEAAANAIMISDSDGKIQWVNSAFTDLTGYEYDEVLGKKPNILNSGQHPSAFFTEMWNTIVQGKTWKGELVNKHKDKSLYHEEMTITPMHNDDGELINFIAIKQDISARKEIEQKIIASETKFRSITSTASDGIISANEKGEIESWNTAAQNIFGYTEDEVKGKPLKIIIPNHYHEGHDTGISRVAIGGKRHVIGKTIELEGQRKDGSIFPIELSLSAWKAEKGMNFSGIIRDITDRKRIEAELANAFETIKLQRDRMQGELDIAKEIQMSMLPLMFPAYPDQNEFEIYSTLVPAREVGGDFYDFFFINEELFCFCIGDVSGKGVPAALFMAVTKTLIKSRASDDISPGSIITHVNDELSRENTKSMFATIFLAITNIKTGEFKYSNAGHDPAYFVNENGVRKELKKLHGPPVGAMEGMSYLEESVFIKPQEFCVLYTDGVTEAMNKNKELFTRKRLENIIQTPSNTSVNQIVQNIFQGVRDFENESEQADDITILAFQYHGYDPEVFRKNLHIECNLEEIKRIIVALEKFSVNHSVSQKIISKLSIAVDELLNNVIQYGYPDNKTTSIYINFELSKDSFSIIFIDEGIPFNPFQQKAPDTSLSADDREIGGLGIHLVKNIMDKVEYHRHINSNVVKITILLENNS